MQQHRQSVRRSSARFPRRANKWRRLRAINGIEDHQVRDKQPCRDWSCVTWIHPERGRINDKINTRKLRAQRSLIPRNRFQPSSRAEDTRHGKKRPQLIGQRLCLLESAIDENETFAIFKRALHRNCPARSPTRAKYHHTQIAQIDRKLAANGTQKSLAISV